MPRLKNFASRKAWEEACWLKLIQSNQGLHRLITPYERRNIVMRAAVAGLLEQGVSYKEIGDELWLSSQTISAIKKGIKDGYKSYAERGKTERIKKVSSPMNSEGRPHYKIGIPRKTKYGTIYL